MKEVQRNELTSDTKFLYNPTSDVVTLLLAGCELFAAKCAMAHPVGEVDCCLGAHDRGEHFGTRHSCAIISKAHCHIHLARQKKG